MTKDEARLAVMGAISMALKDKEPILKKGFEIICKENAELKEENKTVTRKANEAIADKLLITAKYNEVLNDLNQENDKLQKENAELRAIAEFQQSSNMDTHLENKKLKEGLVVGSTLNKGLNSLNKALEEERDKYRNMVFDKDEQLTKAKEIIKSLLRLWNDVMTEETVKALVAEAEQFLKGESTAEQPNECHDCAKFDEMPKGPRCKTCDNGSHFQKKEEA